MKKAYYKTRSGVSLLIALLLVGVLVLFGLIVSNIVISSIRESANITRANQAFYGAEGALELGLLENQEKGAGYTDPAPITVDFTSSCPPGSLCGNFFADLKAQYKIQGQVPDNFNYDMGDPFGVPMPGTGNAGTDCNTINPFVSGSFYYSAASVPHYVSDSSGLQGYTGPFLAKDHPCNWNKIHVGETVTIPLYVTTFVNGQKVVLNPADPDFDLQNLKIRIRTPCDNGDEMCTSTIDRFKLVHTSNDPNATYGGDDPIVFWQIIGTDPVSKESYTLNPFYQYYPDQGWKIAASVIYASKINNKLATDFTMVVENNVGEDEKLCKGPIINFLKNISSNCQTNNWAARTIYKPVLKLTVIHSLIEEASNQTIPYLEYQILTDADIPPANIAQSINAEAAMSTFKQVLEVKQPQETGLLEYVIQQ